MTAATLAHRAVPPPTPAGGTPAGRRFSLDPTVTIQVTLGTGVRDLGGAVRALLDHLNAAGLPSTPVCLVDVTDPVADVGASGREGRAGATDAVLVDLAGRRVTRGGTEIILRRREFDLLHFLVEHPGQVFTRRQLLTAVWGDPFTGERTVDVHVNRLRAKLGGAEELITTVRGVGYRLGHRAPAVAVGADPGGVHPGGASVARLPGLWPDTMAAGAA